MQPTFSPTITTRKQNNAPCCRAITLKVWFKCENSEILKMVGVIKSHPMKIMTTSYLGRGVFEDEHWFLIRDVSLFSTFTNKETHFLSNKTYIFKHFKYFLRDAFSPLCAQQSWHTWIITEAQNWKSS